MGAKHIPANQNNPKREPQGEYGDPRIQQDLEDAQASQKMGEEGGSSQKKSRLPR